MSTTVLTPKHVALDLIDVGENVRDLDPAHVDALAGSIALRDLITPLVVRPQGERFALVAGYHRYAACRKLGLQEVAVTLREHEGSSADSAAENVVRKQLSPLDEARAVAHMLDEGYTLDGAASVLGWSSTLVSSRAKILALPEIAQRLLGSGALPVSTVSVLTKIAEVSRELCDAALAPVEKGELDGAQFVRDPGWALGVALRDTDVWAAYLNTLSPGDIPDLRLGKKIEAAYAEADALHNKLEAHAYGPPRIFFADSDIDQARAAGVLIEFEHRAPIITDRALYRELAKQAIERTSRALRDRKQTEDTDRTSRQAKGQPERTPMQKLDSEHRAAMRQLAARAHGTNLDLGSALVSNLAVVDPNDMDVARFFAYGLLGPDSRDFFDSRDNTVARIAANGIRLMLDEHRTTTTPKLKSGALGKTKVTYGETDGAQAWLWKFLDAAKTAGELYGRTLVVFAAQHYAEQLVLAASKRSPSALPRSHKDAARKAFERVTKNALPATHTQLQRAIEREARAYAKRHDELNAAALKGHADTPHDLDPGDAEDRADEAFEDEAFED
jgi:ParB/RepB/Spo0J family partition protein